MEDGIRTPPPNERIRRLLEQLHTDLSDAEFERIKEQIYLEIEEL